MHSAYQTDTKKTVDFNPNWMRYTTKPCDQTDQIICQLLHIITNSLLTRYGRVWVPVSCEARQTLLNEAHKSRFSIHPGATKMYRDLRTDYWWLGDNSKIIHILLASIPHFYLYFESIFGTTAFLLPKTDNFLQKTDLQQTRQENILEDLGSWFLHCSRREENGSRREAPARAAKEELAPRSLAFLDRKLAEN
ncbi:hypothetical protein OSB04_025787 [Centaurea solstitialis]|uniref:Integrase zinc-binding domain-containing protein n=1 Tax=Centaurea solstitialis TaxID=347529 RepID=A0AA38WBL6_9ASTR|nr:hypothetical protein OSB04_025787 [Centaurea solstitialis]